MKEQGFNIFERQNLFKFDKRSSWATVNGLNWIIFSFYRNLNPPSLGSPEILYFISYKKKKFLSRQNSCNLYLVFGWITLYIGSTEAPGVKLTLLIPTPWAHGSNQFSPRLKNSRTTFKSSPKCGIFPNPPNMVEKCAKLGNKFDPDLTAWLHDCFLRQNWEWLGNLLTPSCQVLHLPASVALPPPDHPKFVKNTRFVVFCRGNWKN